MTITNLFGNYAYRDGFTGLPILVVMHGFTASAYSISDPLARMADYGVFAVAPGMRGRNSATGSQDASGRELWDIYDAVNYVRATFPGVVDPDRVSLVGYSGGGGNGLAMAARFPDLFEVIVSHFGIADYGDDATHGWWYHTSGARKTSLETWVGGTPVTVPNSYKARNHVAAAAQNYTAGRLFLYHDESDAIVASYHSHDVKDALDGLGRTNYEAHFSSSGDAQRWLHGDPIAGDAGVVNIASEANWLTAVAAKTYSPWTVPPSGTLKVCGYVKTKRFELWLGTTTQAGAGGGLDETADLTYDTVAHTYTVTPTTGPTDVYVKEGSRVGTASGISTATVITAT